MEGDGSTVLVQVYSRPDAQGKRIIHANGLVQKVPGGDGKKFRVELKVPIAQGTYVLEVRLLDNLITAGTLELRRVVAACALHAGKGQSRDPSTLARAATSPHARTDV